MEVYGSKSKKERKMQISKRDLKQPGWSPVDKVKTVDWDLLAGRLKCQTEGVILYHEQ